MNEIETASPAASPIPLLPGSLFPDTLVAPSIGSRGQRWIRSRRSPSAVWSLSIFGLSQPLVCGPAAHTPYARCRRSSIPTRPPERLCDTLQEEFPGCAILCAHANLDTSVPGQLPSSVCSWSALQSSAGRGFSERQTSPAVVVLHGAGTRARVGTRIRIASCTTPMPASSNPPSSCPRARCPSIARARRRTLWSCCQLPHDALAARWCRSRRAVDRRIPGVSGRWARVHELAPWVDCDSVYVARSNLVVPLDQRDTLEAMSEAARPFNPTERNTMLCIIGQLLREGVPDQIGKPYTMARTSAASLRSTALRWESRPSLTRSLRRKSC